MNQKTATKWRRFSTRLRWLPVVVGCAICLGCGNSDSVSYVTGTVKYAEGEVPTETRVFFELPGKGYLAAGIVQEDGTYQLKYKRAAKIQPGEFVVYLGPPATYLSEQEFRQLKKKVDAEFRSRGKSPPPSPDWVLPEKYYKSATSPLRATVEPGENVIDLTLED